MGCVESVAPPGVMPRKQKKPFIKTHLLVEVALNEDIHVIFGE